VCYGEVTFPFLEQASSNLQDLRRVGGMLNPDIPEAESLRDRFDQFDITRIYILRNLLTRFKICKCGSLVPAPVWQGGHSVGSNARPISIKELSNYEDPHEILAST
jgi:hypothetical protein